MSSLRNLVWLGSLLVMPLLTSCSYLPKQLQIQATPVKTERITYARPSKIVKQQFQPFVINYDTTTQINADIDNGVEQKYGYICFVPDEYINMAQWMDDVLRYIEASNFLINKYEEDAAFDNARNNKDIVEDSEQDTD